MGSNFNPQILVDKLAKLNNSQQSIETLSHWCIFHMNKAKQVVETWSRQFHSSPPDQRLAFLYLANDILQNSRRKGAEFVGEFWKVLPDALRYVIRNGDDFGRNAALRLINIWDERKVFGSRGQLLKEEFGRRQAETSHRVGRQTSLKLRHGLGNALDKIVSGYEVIYGGQLDEDVVINRCKSAISCMEKVEKDIGTEMNSGQFDGSAFVGELQGQRATLKECVEQLRALETSRENLVSQLRGALQEQEFKLDQVRNQLKAAEQQSEQATSISQQLQNSNNIQTLESQHLQEGQVPNGNGSDEGEQPGSVVYTMQEPSTEKGRGVVKEDDPKSAAAAMAAQLTASSSSHQMLTYILSTFAQEGVLGGGNGNGNGSAKVNETHEADYPSEKRIKLEGDQSSYVPPPPLQPPSPMLPAAHTENFQQNGSTVTSSQEVVSTMQQPPPPSSPPPPLPPLPPLPPFAFMQAGAVSNMQPFTYSPNQQQPSLPMYPPAAGQPGSGVPQQFAAGPPGYQNFQIPDGGFYNQQPPSMPIAPISRQ